MQNEWNSNAVDEWEKTGRSLQEMTNKLLSDGFFALEDTINRGVDLANMPTEFEVYVFKSVECGDNLHIVYKVTPRELKSENLEQICKRIVKTAVYVLNKEN